MTALLTVAQLNTVRQYLETRRPRGIAVTPEVLEAVLAFIQSARRSRISRMHLNYRNRASRR